MTRRAEFGHAASSQSTQFHVSANHVLVQEASTRTFPIHASRHTCARMVSTRNSLPHQRKSWRACMQSLLRRRAQIQMCMTASHVRCLLKGSQSMWMGLAHAKPRGSIVLSRMSPVCSRVGRVVQATATDFHDKSVGQRALGLTDLNHRRRPIRRALYGPCSSPARKGCPWTPWPGQSRDT